MIAGDGHAAEDRLGLAGRRDLAVLQGIAHDAVVDLGVEAVLVDRDAGAAVPALGKGLTETLDLIGFPLTLISLQRDKEAAIWRRIVVVVDTAPGIHEHRAVRRHGHLARMADLVGKDRCAEALGQRDSAVRLRTGLIFAGRQSRAAELEHGECEHRTDGASGNRVSRCHLRPPRT